MTLYSSSNANVVSICDGIHTALKTTNVTSVSPGTVLDEDQSDLVQEHVSIHVLERCWQLLSPSISSPFRLSRDDEQSPYVVCPVFVGFQLIISSIPFWTFMSFDCGKKPTQTQGTLKQKSPSPLSDFRESLLEISTTSKLWKEISHQRSLDFSKVSFSFNLICKSSFLTNCDVLVQKLLWVVNDLVKSNLAALVLH